MQSAQLKNYNAHLERIQTHLVDNIQDQCSNRITDEFRKKVAAMRLTGMINEKIAAKLNCSPKRTRRAWLQWYKANKESIN